MHFRQMKTEEIALILMGLRTIYVADQEAAREKLIAACEGALSARGVALADDTPPPIKLTKWGFGGQTV